MSAYLDSDHKFISQQQFITFKIHFKKGNMSRNEYAKTQAALCHVKSRNVPQFREQEEAIQKREQSYR